MNATSNTQPKYVRVRAVTKAKKESVTVHKDIYTIAVKEKPEQGKANNRIRELLARTLNCPNKALRLIKGAQSPSKLFQLLNISNYHENKH